MVYFLALLWICVVLRGLFKREIEIDELSKLIGFAFGTLIPLTVWTVFFLVLSFSVSLRFIGVCRCTY
jgi:hypothetical protein